MRPERGGGTSEIAPSSSKPQIQRSVSRPSRPNKPLFRCPSPVPPVLLVESPFVFILSLIMILLVRSQFARAVLHSAQCAQDRIHFHKEGRRYSR